MQNWENQLLVLSCLSVCQHGIARLPQDRYYWTLVYEDFSEICPENSSLIKIEHLYEDIQKFSWYLVNSSKNEKFFWKRCRLWDNVEKYGRTRQATGDDIIWRRNDVFACWITNARIWQMLIICNTYCLITD